MRLRGTILTDSIRQGTYRISYSLITGGKPPYLTSVVWHTNEHMVNSRHSTYLSY